MHRFPRILLMIAGIILLVLPPALLLLRTPQVVTLFPAKSRVSLSSRYSVESSVRGYTLTLVDTAYLDYITAKLNIFTANTIIGLEFYTGKLANTKRHQINHITFVLVDHVDAPISVVTLDSGGRRTVDCQGEYILDGSTLIARVAAGFDALGKQLLTDKYAWENSFLRCALNTLYYAKGVADPTTNYQALVGIKEDIDNNVYSGLFVWPFRITQSSL